MVSKGERVMGSIEIPQYWVNKCLQFAEDCIESSKALYAYRGASKTDKIKEDIYIGKMGEVGVYLSHKADDKICSKPDFKIYKGRRKSFDADLFMNERAIHVKSQSSESARRYGNSWLFQRSDPVYINPNDDLFYGTMVQDKTVFFIKKCKINELLFEECKLEWFRKTKIAIYHRK